eukprot:278540_1
MSSGFPSPRNLFVLIVIGVMLMVFSEYYIDVLYRSDYVIESHFKSPSRDHKDISFIIATRNDNYGNDPILRLRLTLQQLLLFQWNRKYNISVEIIVVEWNPIATNPHIWEYNEIQQLLAHKQRFSHRYKSQIIFYSIPSAYNDKANCVEDRPTLYCPFFEYHAKNVGLRRSYGEWKLIMNIDDLFSIPLLHTIGYHIKHKLLDKKGIYEAHKRRIELKEEYIYGNITLIPLEKATVRNINRQFEQCIRRLGTWQLLPSSGDFMLIHNRTLYSFYVGGFVETCSNLYLDSEFVARQLYVNKLNAYQIVPKCGYFHMDHYRQRLSRNDTTSRTYAMKDQKEINCNQKEGGSQAMQQRTQRNGFLAFDSYWSDVYNYTHYNWGMKDIEFVPMFVCDARTCKSNEPEKLST